VLPRYGIRTGSLTWCHEQTNGSPVWTSRLTNLLDATLSIFFPGGIAYEVSCETDNFSDAKCNADMLSYKGYLHRWLAVVAQLSPSLTASKIAPILRSSAQAAVKQCTGGASGRECGFHWSSGRNDGRTGAGQEMNVLGALTSVLILMDGAGIPGPVTNATGGMSPGDWNAGSRSGGVYVFGPITQADRAGAGVLTALLLIGGLSTWAWMSTSFWEGSFD
jgi:mannan endo-1,6-alpha-mannosidase